MTLLPNEHFRGEGGRARGEIKLLIRLTYLQIARTWKQTTALSVTIWSNFIVFSVFVKGYRNLQGTALLFFLMISSV